MSALRGVLLGLTTMSYLLPLPVAGPGNQSAARTQLELVAHDWCKKLSWSRETKDVKVEALFGNFVESGARTLEKDVATIDDINKAMDQLKTFCDTLETRVEKLHPGEPTITLDDFLAIKRMSSYPFEKEAIGEAEKLAFELAFNFANGLIVLTSGILALTITFRKDLAGTSTSSKSERWLKTSWVTYLASIVAGIITMMGLIGPLNPRPENPQSFLFGPSIVVPQMLQLVSFATGTAFFVLYGVGAWAIRRRAKHAS